MAAGQSDGVIITPALPQGLTSTSVPTFGGIVGPAAAPGTSRGFIVQLGKVTGVNLNAAASTTIFTTPASGFTRCVVLRVIRDNESIAATTVSVQFGTAGGADWAATAVNANAATGRYQEIPSVATLSPTYGTATTFQVTVTIVQGAAATADFSAWGFFE